MRCQQTVGPLAHRTGADLVVHPALFEGGAAEATELVRDLAAARGDAVHVLCSHADVIPQVLRDLLLGGLHVTGPRGCAKGSAWELTVEDGRPVSGRYVPRPGSGA